MASLLRKISAKVRPDKAGEASETAGDDAGGQTAVLRATSSSQLVQRGTTVPSLGLSYVTERLLLARPQRRLRGRWSEDLARFLDERHAERYMVWSVASKPRGFAGDLHEMFLETCMRKDRPPTLEALLQVCQAVRSWLAADESNVAVVTADRGSQVAGLVVACCMLLDETYDTAAEALYDVNAYVALDSPSMRRYATYVADMVAGVRQRTDAVPIVLKRIVLHDVPRYGIHLGDWRKGNPLHLVERGQVCRPYVEVRAHDDTVLFRSSPAESAFTDEDGRIAIEVDNVLVQGDVSIHFFHILKGKLARPMFHFAAHSAFVPTGVLRLRRDELDNVSASTAVYSSEFFVDLMFATDIDDEIDPDAVHEHDPTETAWFNMTRARTASDQIPRRAASVPNEDAPLEPLRAPAASVDALMLKQRAAAAGDDDDASSSASTSVDAAELENIVLSSDSESDLEAFDAQPPAAFEPPAVPESASDDVAEAVTEAVAENAAEDAQPARNAELGAFVQNVLGKAT